MSKVYKMGWQKDDIDERDVLYSPALSSFGEIPEAIDLYDKSPWRFDQGPLSSCTANASLSLYGFVKQRQLDAGEIDDNPMLSRLFQYYNTRALGGTAHYDSGGQLRNSMKALHQWGCCPEDLWDYSKNVTTRPNTDCYKAALDHQTISYSKVFQNETLIKKCLSDGFPIVFGIMLKDSIWKVEKDKKGLYVPKGSQIGGHAVMLVGYTDSWKGTGRKMARVQTSWGTSWGDKGTWWMDFDILLKPDVCVDFWTCRVVE